MDEEDHMYDVIEENPGPSPDSPTLAPPLRLAGIDEDDGWEPHVVRGID
jgi:hypothetical protein